jgi:hypothetical protein
MFRAVVTRRRMVAKTPAHLRPSQEKLLGFRDPPLERAYLRAEPLGAGRALDEQDRAFLVAKLCHLLHDLLETIRSHLAETTNAMVNSPIAVSNTL